MITYCKGMQMPTLTPDPTFLFCTLFNEGRMMLNSYKYFTGILLSHASVKEALKKQTCILRETKTMTTGASLVNANYAQV